MLGRKKKAVAGFAVIFSAYLAIIAYLLFFSPGLEFKTIEGKLYLENESSHIIREITVLLDNEIVIDCIEELGPGEMIRVSVPEGLDVYTVTATAAFHRELRETVRLGDTSADVIAVNTRQERAFAGRDFAFFLEICNRGAEDLSLRINEQHEESFLKEENKTVLAKVNAGKCRTLKYDFTPIKKGVTTIEFRIIGERVYKSFSEEIEIE